MLLENTVLATVMVALTVLVHFLGMVGLSSFAKRRAATGHLPATIARQAGVVLVVILSLFVLHTIEIWLYAWLYLILGEFETLEAALYFSTSTFTTVGFGDLYLDEKWRLLSAIQSANGFLLIGWSTAYLVTVMGLIHDIEGEIRTLRQSSAIRRPDDD